MYVNVHICIHTSMCLLVYVGVCEAASTYSLTLREETKKEPKNTYLSREK